MHRLWRMAFLILLGSMAPPLRADDSQKTYDFSKLTATIQKAVEAALLEGACLLVVQNGETLHEQCFGSYKPDTVIAIASASKWLSAATIMTLVDEGKLNLDDPVSKFLPKFTASNGHITIRQLLSHTSGLPGQVPAMRDFRITLAEAVDKIAEVELVAEPGTEFRYGGVSMQVAGRIAETISGKSWAELFQERIAGPCQMPNTRYGRVGLDRNPQIAGGASSTLNDYRNFLTMILNRGEFKGRRVLSEEAIRQMEHDQTRGAESKEASLVRLLAGTKYGLGEWLDRQDVQGQGIEISSPGAFGFRPWIDREHNLLGVLVAEIRDQRVKRSLASFRDVPVAVRKILAETAGQ